MRAVAWALVAVIGLVACGGARRPVDDPGDELAAATAPHEPDCAALLDHLDALLGAAFTRGGGTPVYAANRPMTHDDVATDCPLMTAWVRACLRLSPTAGELRECAPEVEPTLAGYAGPSAYQKQKFDECAEAARDRAALAGCSYYRPGPGRVPLHPAHP